MPPRKRAKVSQATSPTPTSNPKTPTPAHEDSPSNSADEHLNDPWTDEEEIGLFKGLMTWKPTGIHKHFRLLALHQYLLTNGYIHPRNPHTQPHGIWAKLGTLYDLEALDEREDARQLSDLSLSHSEDGGEEDDGDMYSEAENKIHREDFGLPEEEFGEMVWRSRLAGDGEEEGSGSEAELPELNLAEERPVRFTPSFDFAPSETATPSVKGGGARGRAAGAAAGTAKGKGRAAATTRRSARQAESVQESPEPHEEPQEEADEDEEGSAEEDEETAESEASAPAATAKSTRAARGRARVAAPAAKSRAKRRR